MELIRLLARPRQKGGRIILHNCVCNKQRGIKEIRLCNSYPILSNPFKTFFSLT